jgi:hypothetical protein
MGYETEDSVKQELRDLLRRLRMHGCAPSDQVASEVAAGLVDVWRLDPELAEDVLEEANTVMSWPTATSMRLKLRSARLGARGRVAVDAIWTKWSRLSQPDHRLSAEQQKASHREARALHADLSERTERVYSGAAPAEGLVAWACTVEPTLVGWLKAYAPEVADG